MEINVKDSPGFRGWDAADELLLSQSFEAENILVIEDNNGALTCGLQAKTVYTSNILNRDLIAESLKMNNLEADIITSLTDLPETVDLVVMRLPKFIDLLEYFIQIIGKRYPGVSVVVTGMAKYMPISMVRLMEEYFDGVRTSLTKKKARLIFGTAAFNCISPKKFPMEFDSDGLTISSYPGVFSADHLDIGTRFLKDSIPSSQAGTILDLGCGSGLLGLRAKQLNPECDVVLTDVSYLAVESAKESFKNNMLDADFIVMDCLKDYPVNSVDLILCNPPFHQGNRVLTDVAVEMFKQSKKVLKRGGTMLIVANKHLGYHKKLRAIYHNLKRVAENEKFFIFSVHK